MRIAVIGLGFMGSTHLKALKQMSGVELVAVASNDPKALSGDLSGIQGNLGGPGERLDFSKLARFEDPIEAARAPGIDAVDICLPTNLHAPVTLAALETGKHVLVEKPMALNREETAAMIDAARGAGRVLMCAQVLRFFPAYLPLIDGLLSGRFGRVHHAVFRRRCAAPGWSAWLTDKSQSGGGVFDLLIHDIDMALTLFGLPDAVSAWGHEALARGVDMVTAQLHYPGIPSVTISGGWHHPKAYPFSMEYTVVGEHGAMEYSSAGRDPRWYDNSGAEQPLELSAADGYQAELEYFIDCARSGKAPDRCTPESSAAAVAVALLMDQARARKGEPVPCQL
jgi:predicted dehydrogenase